MKLLVGKQNNNKEVYLMKRGGILFEAFCVWGKKDGAKPNKHNDYVCLVPILLHPDNCDRMEVVNDY